jgi:hypothetical protein
MLGVALATIAVGIVFLFFVPWIGIALGIVGLVLLGVRFAAGRRVAEPRT